MQRILGLIVIISLFAAAAPASEPLFPKDAVVLFQGDSITDGARGRSADPNHILGHGYAFAIASELGGDRPEMNWTFVNRGVSGDTLVQLKNRWENDALALKPDVLSILIGVNDVARGEETADEYRERYDALLAQTREALPNVLLVIVEPFATEPFVSGAPDRAEKISLFQRAARELAEKYDAVFVPTQKMFEDAEKTAPRPAYWIWDGVHPTYSGHRLLQKAWLKAVSERFSQPQ